MTDIVERLRKEGVFKDVFSGELKTDPLCLDAITEIEALRQRLTTWTDLFSEWDSPEEVHEALISLNKDVNAMRQQNAEVKQRLFALEAGFDKTINDYEQQLAELRKAQGDE